MEILTTAEPGASLEFKTLSRFNGMTTRTERTLGIQMRLTVRLSQCFDETNRDQAKDYLDSIQDPWREISTAITRNAWIIVLLLAVFELAAHKALSGLTLGPFALANISYVRLFIPPVVTYIFYEQLLLATRWIETETVHRYLVQIVSPKIEENDFDYFLTPRLPALSNLAHSYSITAATPSKRIRAATQYCLSVLIIIAIPAFDAFALYELSAEFGASNPLYWIVTIITAAILIASLSVFGLWLAEERLVV